MAKGSNVPATIPALGGDASLNRYLAEIRKFPILKPEQEYMLAKRYAEHQDPEAAALVPDQDYLRELNEAYQHFFFHYSATSLLVVETSHVDFRESEEAFDGLLKQVRGMGRGTRYYVPRTS